MDNGEWKTTHFDGYDVIDKGNGLSVITVPEDPKPEPEKKPSGFFAKLLDWFRKSPVTPYAKVRDLSDPTMDRRMNPDDIDVGSDGKIAGEIGIKIRF